MSRLRTFASLVKFEHTVFALPHAYAAFALAHDDTNGSWIADLLWVTVAMVAARTLGMALNRLIDARIDARNPRTAIREIPSGKLSPGAVVGLCAVSLALLIVSTTQLHPVTRWLWPIPVVMFVLYPYTKRFTWACHLILGATIALAPVGAWLAVRGELNAMIVVMWLAVAAWVAGFDLIYATQDVDFDRAEKLHSIPARFGIPAALRLARVLHVITFAGLLAVVALEALNPLALIGLVVVGALLLYEHSLVRADDLTRVDAAFFTVNGYIGVVWMAAVLLGLL
jgi:4-hydroxybenzoate polyprenyltransferase